MISEEIRKEFASGVLISDVNAYVDSNPLKYEEWLKNRKGQNSKNTKGKERNCDEYKICRVKQREKTSS